MKSKVLGLLMCLATAVPTFVGAQSRRGAESGGGGGGVCTATRCMTLAQAGLRIDLEKTNEFRISDEVIAEIMTILKKLPVSFEYTSDHQDFFRKTYTSTFVVVGEKETRAFRKFKQEYFSILASTEMDSRSFQLLAVSKDHKTYILPGFELLDTRGKALLLIHEALIRDYGASVAQALAFDGKLMDYLNADEAGNSEEHDTWPLVKSLANIDKISRYSSYRAPLPDFMINMNYLMIAVSQDDQPITINELCSDIRRLERGTFSCLIRMEKALELNRLRPDFARTLGDKEVQIEIVSLRDFESSSNRHTDPWAKAVYANVVKVCEQNPNLVNTITVVSAEPYSTRKALFSLNCK